ncbi:hypothetical protein B0I35DRAFT_483635 [Stachybotrys elegans]|uniref:Conidiation-specific protein 6 n=1 Tax=Stachybotrys elegans TaxID=80388 RepID=A0A8K0SKT9_9HYPO|nr:hypothetical protein B0I35DRAFT_483635 [Stachybotrys elegans]
MNSAGDRSVLSSDMQELTEGKERTADVIRGHKANLSNPNTSEASKENSAKAIENLGGDAVQEGNKAKPRSKNAAENLDGTRATAA